MWNRGYTMRAAQIQLRPANVDGDAYVAAFAQTQLRRPGPAAAAMDRTGRPQFYIRPGLVDMAALNKLEQQKMDLRFRRERLDEQRRQRYPIPSQVEYTDMMNSQVQGFWRLQNQIITTQIMEFSPSFLAATLIT
ncbi:unnamed protein product [Symbiodinium natans]|uniref:Uncharacterized protein n=1 Tax=Symbiodinium natans TaxID=878477 RepID=A0A812IA34_9DINO|nr:unnamed protein product [Symbiodinium natans]